jgi:hypothetical protein
MPSLHFSEIKKNINKTYFLTLFLDKSPNAHPEYYIYTMLKKKVET